MLKIAHRINSIEMLKSTPKNYGVELDLRDYNNQISITHNPLTEGDNFEEYMKHYEHELIILNVKCEGVEDLVEPIIKKHQIKNYFYLDVSFPALIKLYRRGEKNIAVRFSEYEPIENCLALKGMVNWVWVDCFNKMPLDLKSYEALKKHFKLCLVSPELQGYDVKRIDKFKEQLKDFEIDAVCTKRPDLW